MRPERWEVGSDFHISELRWGGGDDAPWAGHPHALYAAGRDPVISIVTRTPTRRLWVPSYFCQDVLRAWRNAGIDLRMYRDAPMDPVVKSLPARPDDAVLSVSYFGVRAPAQIHAEGGQPLIIEDHTHDPLSTWARHSRADFCIASLRKTLPLPDGAVAWSPRGRELAPPALMEPRRVGAVLDRLIGMQLKARYLRGDAVEKDAYRRCAVRGEEMLAATAPSAASEYATALIAAFPQEDWRQTRAKNHAVFVHAFRASEELVSVVAAPPDSVPFSGLLHFSDPNARDRVRSALIAQRVYPATLWALAERVVGDIPDEHIALSKRLLSLHCDGRYDAATMRDVAEIVMHALEVHA
jgi:hypothetical protein